MFTFYSLFTLFPVEIIKTKECNLYSITRSDLIMLLFFQIFIEILQEEGLTRLMAVVTLASGSLF